jgi:uncharacterized protein
MKTPWLHSLSPLSRLVFFVLLIITCFSIVFIISLAAAIPLFNTTFTGLLSLMTDFKDPRSLAILQYFQVVQSFGLFIIPPLLAGWFYSRDAFGYLGLNRSPKPAIYGLSLLLIFLMLPFLNWLVNVNEAMVLPSILKNLEEWMQSAEAQAAELTDAFLSNGSYGGLFFNLFMIAILPAIGEELMFRGVLQRLFHEWTKNIHIAVFLAALVFGLFHLQFYGLLPRVFLGMVFGYLFYWTGSLWVPIFLHFANNASAVIAAWAEARGMTTGRWEDFGSTDSVLLIITSFLLTGISMYFIFRIEKNKRADVPSE